MSRTLPGPPATSVDAHAELADWLDLLRHLQDPAAIGALVALFAHGANNRLTVILSCLDVLGTAGLAAADARAALELARGASTDLSRELAAMQAATHRDEPRLGRVELIEAARAGAHWFDLLGIGNMAVDLDIPAELQVLAEPSVLPLAILRLLRLAHACEANSVGVHGDTIELASRTRERPVLRAGRYARLEFTCARMRLPATLLESRGGPGQVLDRLHDRHGLEFAAVEACAASLRGQLLAQSTSDGDCFELYLPLAPAPA